MLSSCNGSGSVNTSTNNATSDAVKDNVETPDETASTLKIFSFDGKPVSTLLGSSTNEVAKAIGEPDWIETDDFGTIHRFDYDGIHLWFDDDVFVRAESSDCSKLAVDGVSINKNRAELIKAIGKPSDEGRDEGFYGADDAYVMLYELPNGVGIFLEFSADALDVPPYLINVQKRW